VRLLGQVHSARTAVAGERNTLSFAALDAAASAWAASFTAAGLRRGAHIGLLAGNTPDWLAVAFGVWRAGATLVPISTFVTARELAETLGHADVGALVVQSQLRSHDYLALLEQVPQVSKVCPVVVLNGAPANRYQRAADFLTQRVGTPPDHDGEDIDPNSIACILYTSGTTGQPKGVMLSHRAILATVLPTAQRSGLTSTDALLSTLPLFWVAGLVIRALPTLATGCALMLIETFTVDAVLAALRRYRPTALHLRPPQVGQLLAHPEFGAALLAPVRRGGGRVEWYAPHLPADAAFITGYGMTETAGYATALDWRDSAHARQHTLGAPLPGVVLRITGPDGRACSPGDVGEVRVRSPGLFSGYYKQPPGTGLDEEGFFITGDLGSFAEDGTFQFVGRSKDLLRVKGINVSPVEVETVLSAHAGVEAAYVVGLPPDGLEQRIVALVVRKPGADVSEADLRAAAHAALSHYKRPEAYLFIERAAVALSGTSKPQRAALAALASARLGRVDSVGE